MAGRMFFILMIPVLLIAFVVGLLLAESREWE